MSKTPVIFRQVVIWVIAAGFAVFGCNSSPSAPEPTHSYIVSVNLVTVRGGAIVAMEILVDGTVRATVRCTTPAPCAGVIGAATVSTTSGTHEVAARVLEHTTASGSTVDPQNYVAVGTIVNTSVIGSVVFLPPQDTALGPGQTVVWSVEFPGA